MLCRMVRRAFHRLRKGLVRLPVARLPRVLFENYIQPTAEDFELVTHDTEIEREWWLPHPRFETSDDLLQAAEDGRVVRVAGNEDYLPIMRLRNPRLEAEYPPFLTPHCKALLG